MPIYPPNRQKWQVDDLVLADADAKDIFMLMVVVSDQLTREEEQQDLIALRYLVPRRNYGTERIYKGHYSHYHDPRIWLNMAAVNLHELAEKPKPSRNPLGVRDLDSMGIVGEYGVILPDFANSWLVKPQAAAVFDAVAAMRDRAHRHAAFHVPGDEAIAIENQFAQSAPCRCTFWHDPATCAWPVVAIAEAFCRYIDAHDLVARVKA